MESERCVLILEPVSNRVNVPVGQTVYDALVALNYPIGALCGGAGTCGKCLIKVVDPAAKLSPPTERELEKLGSRKISEGMRLACQTKVLGDSRILLSDAIMPKGNRILVDSDIDALGIDKDVSLDPLVSSLHVRADKPTIQQPTADFTRVLEKLREKDDPALRALSGGITDEGWMVAQELPRSIRQSAGDVTAILRHLVSEKPGEFVKKIIAIEPGDTSSTLFGLAVDIGTTTIVGYLINLISGELAAISAMLNPQVAIGEDVISRMTYVMQNDHGGEKAQSLVVGAINSILEDTCRKAGIDTRFVKDITVVGNTAMHHLFFRLPTKHLGLSPFVPVFKAPINVRSELLGLVSHPNANVYSPPVVAGYVGTDTIGCMVSTRMDTFDKYSLLIDIGTNGELVLGNKDGLVTGSCAAGSALEGAEISFGMRAAEGAIESVSIDPVTLEPRMSVIGNRDPLGICGSGLIDVTAAMLKAKVITRRGKFNNNSTDITSNKRVIKDESGYKYILYHPDWDEGNVEDHLDHAGTGDESRKIITVSQGDIRQMQLAKGAFLSGALLLLEHGEKSVTDLEQVILAGAFGSYINKENAMFIGLFPEVKGDAIYQVGNAAGLGAQFCLKNNDYRVVANDIAFKAKYHEISTSPRFQREYAYSLYFPHHDLEKFPTISEQYEDIPLK
ncbi:MAG: ASKHA domain-containing protein [Promethearchaeota archaeon]